MIRANRSILATSILSSALTFAACNEAAVPTGSDASPQASAFKTSTQSEAAGLARQTMPSPRSIIELIARPGAFKGLDVLVGGYFVADDAHAGKVAGQLFLDNESATMNLQRNALNVSFGRCRTVSSQTNLLDPSDPDQYSNNYVMVGGTFEPAPENSAELGTLCGITRITMLEDLRRSRPDR